jgi:hypothetical protein
VTTLAEPEWDTATRDLVLALDAVDMCPRCGGPAYLCQDPERQYDWDVSAPVRCHATTAIRERQRGVTEKTNPHVDALIWRAQLKDRRGP